VKRGASSSSTGQGVVARRQQQHLFAALGGGSAVRAPCRELRVTLRRGEHLGELRPLRSADDRQDQRCRCPRRARSTSRHSSSSCERAACALVHRDGPSAPCRLTGSESVSASVSMLVTLFLGTSRSDADTDTDSDPDPGCAATCGQVLWGILWRGTTHYPAQQPTCRGIGRRGIVPGRGAAFGPLSMSTASLPELMPPTRLRTMEDR
jgi:hypothetical protein